MLSKVTTALSFERQYFFLFLQNITVHLLEHIVEDIEEFGPAHGRWCFPMERSLCWLARQTRQKHYQESCIMKTYRVSYGVTTFYRRPRSVGVHKKRETSNGLFLNMNYISEVHTCSMPI